MIVQTYFDTDNKMATIDGNVTNLLKYMYCIASY